MLEQTLNIIFYFLLKIIPFMLGETHRTMGTAYMLVGVNALIALFKRIPFLQVSKEYSERFFAYTVLIMIGHILDTLMVSQLFGWEGSSQLLACLYIIIRELSTIRDYLSQRHDINMPIINSRLKQMQGRYQYNSEDVTQRIEELKKELSQLEEIKSNETAES